MEKYVTHEKLLHEFSMKKMIFSMTKFRLIPGIKLFKNVSSEPCKKTVKIKNDFLPPHHPL